MNVFKLIGRENRNYTRKDTGEYIEARNLYFTYPLNEGAGEGCRSEFVRCDRIKNVDNLVIGENYLLDETVLNNGVHFISNILSVDEFARMFGFKRDAK